MSAASSGLDERGGFPQRLLVESGDSDVCALFGERDGHGTADPGSRAGDEDGLVGE